jgi:hypothetical protein
MNFRILKEFPEIFNRIKDFRKDKDVNSVWAYCGPRPCGNGLAQRPKWPGWPETSAWRGRTPDVVSARRGEGVATRSVAGDGLRCIFSGGLSTRVVLGRRRTRWWKLGLTDDAGRW